MNKLIYGIGILSLLFSNATYAKTVILIHGLDSDRNTWYENKVVKPLFSSGFKDATKNLFIDPKELKNSTQANAKNVFYTVDLAWFKPLESQANSLKDVLSYIYQQRNEPLILVGHSVGGVVARLYLLSKNPVPVVGLITIASPHHGSPWAEATWLALQSPMGDFISLMGENKWSKSEQLLWQLSPSVKHSMINWMNDQPHPKLRYISIIHTPSFKRMAADILVPAVSQNMNYIPALYKRSAVVTIRSGHSLSKRDGLMLAKILGTFK
jgi:pimeloyl-ACP methyl ester carboxylesterase